MDVTLIEEAISKANARIAKNLRYYRVLKGLNQESVADFAAVSYQQIQKYETGANAIRAARLKMIADGMKIPVGYFFGVPDGLVNMDYIDIPDSTTIALQTAITHASPEIRTTLVQLLKTMRPELLNYEPHVFPAKQVIDLA